MGVGGVDWGWGVALWLHGGDGVPQDEIEGGFVREWRGMRVFVEDHDRHGGIVVVTWPDREARAARIAGVVGFAGVIRVAGAGEVGPIGGHGFGELVVDGFPGTVDEGEIIISIGNLGGVEGAVLDEIAGGRGTAAKPVDVYCSAGIAFHSGSGPNAGVARSVGLQVGPRVVLDGHE